MTSLLRQTAEQTVCPTCNAYPNEPCVHSGFMIKEAPEPFHLERYVQAKATLEGFMASKTQRELLEVGLLTHTEAEQPLTDIESLLRALVRITSTVADLAKEVREIRNKI